MTIETKINADLSLLKLDNLNNMESVSWRVYDTYENRRDNLLLILERISKIVEAEKKLSLYLLVGDSVYRENNRMATYFKLWKYLKRIGLEVRNGIYSKEVSLHVKDKVKFFGAIKLNTFVSLQNVIEILMSQINSHLLIMPDIVDVEILLYDGFSYHIRENKEYLQKIISKKGLAIFREGEFDDMYSGFLGIGDSDVVNKFLFK
ncbi:hypothetical protein HYE59_00795 [Aggregatibacter actinomycetemcomitans]|uniref:hypothetical protein n=1 Tax=Aggregatibacter actinomycetemcomitans TaxID=714 RepID=UPI00197C40D6|nr:hypothetical protein [Aggregatibacter actinomycetemcomitans]MBN6076113.1 hypothetical protein [Aggregatibacter actinomycetemcomitans]